METVFNQHSNHMTANLFMGDDNGIARYETVNHSVIDKLTEKQLSFFWRPEEVDLSKDVIDYNSLSEDEQFIFTQNLKYQSLLDSVQGRAPNLCFLPITSDVALETWIATWAFSETIHSRSYTHIMRNLYNDPSEVFDRIVLDETIMKRANSVTEHYDALMGSVVELQSLRARSAHPDVIQAQTTVVKENLYLAMHAVNALEAIRFYFSFSCTFSFGERGIMEGNSKIMRLIARDEQLHLKGTQYIIRTWQAGSDDPEMVEIAKRLEGRATQLVLDVIAQEKEWATGLMTKAHLPGYSLASALDYIDYLGYSRMRSVGLTPNFSAPDKHPLPWMRKWLNSDSVQVAAQEAEISSYLIGQVDANLDADFFEDLKI